MSSSQIVSVVLIGCGSPLKSMGWYHAEQLLNGRCPSAQLKIVVEPFFMMNDNCNIPGYNEFQQWKQHREEKDGIQFYDSVDKVPSYTKNDEIRLVLISSRTSDNPKLFYSSIAIGCTAIFLEKPGAPSVVELEQMKVAADTAKIHVYMGFNKNVSSYVSRTLQYAQKVKEVENKKCDIIFLHNNAYNTNNLPECFERNSEGILKNMAIHELAILVSYFNVTVDTIESVVADPVESSCLTLSGPSSGQEYTDFGKIKFKIKTKAGTEAIIAADRCGGDDSVGIVLDCETGSELARFTMPDNETIAKIPTLEAMYPGAMPYFFTQDPDYAELKQRVAEACLAPTNDNPVGVATIDTAIKALQLAEFLTPLLQEQLKS